MIDEADPLEEEAQDYKTLIPIKQIKKEESSSFVNLVSVSRNRNKKRKVSEKGSKIDSDDGNGGGSSGASDNNKLKLFVDYFEIIATFENDEYKRKQVEVRCKICEKHTTLKGVYGVSSNFLKHLKRVHPTDYALYKEGKEESTPNKNRNGPKPKHSEKLNHEQGKSGSIKIRRVSQFKQIDYPIPKFSKVVKANTKYHETSRNEKINQAKVKNFDKRLLKFIISTMSPLSIIENKSFKDLFEGTDLIIMNKKLAEKKFDSLYTTSLKLLKSKIMKFHYCCTTIDVWSYRNQNFIGITCHWLDEQLKRRSAVLCCKRFYSNVLDGCDIEKILTETYEKYEISSKIVTTIIDNGLNFGEAYEEIGIQSSCINYCPIDDDSYDDMVGLYTDEIQYEYISNPENVFQQHIRSASHQISLIVTEDFINYLKSDISLIEKNKQIFAKCTQLWNKAKSSKGNEIITESLGYNLDCPCSIKWNSMYDALHKILQNQNKLNELCEKLNILSFEVDDLNYLNEYCILMKPFADALEFIQQEKNCYYGYLIPTLATIMTKLRKLEMVTQINFLVDCITYLKDNLVKRFYDIFTLQPNIYDAVIASIVCPAVKIRWLNVMKETAPNFDIRVIDDKIINLMEQNAQQLETHKIKCANQSSNQSAAQPFFDFDEVADYYPNTSYGAGVDYYNYLNETRTDNQVLEDYPTIKNLFLKYNTPLLSYAGIRKLLSYSKIYASQCSNDVDFEKLIFLKSNYGYFDEHF